jgi:hypothetical protein
MSGGETFRFHSFTVSQLSFLETGLLNVDVIDNDKDRVSEHGDFWCIMALFGAISRRLRAFFDWAG